MPHRRSILAPVHTCRPEAWLLAAGLFLGLTVPAALAQLQTATCSDCHPEQVELFEVSVHQGAVRCQDCHGGKSSYELTSEQRSRFLLEGSTRRSAATQALAFDHGNSFRGTPARAGVPELCGTCHADVERMNPYGLRTDQLSAYWVSGHGKRLKQSGDERVAVCVDCHSTHDVLRHDNPRSRTHFRNIPATCARCHADRDLMQEYNLSASIIEQYRNSVHGRYVLEGGDPGAPNCATCHGSHGAAPPGFAQVGHVCGQCHRQIEDYFLTGTHGRIPGMVRCVKCHGGGGDPRNHRIEEASPPVEELVEVYAQLRDEVGDRPEVLRSRFTEAVDGLSGSLRLDAACRYCHAGQRRPGGHGIFFENSDRLALERGKELSALLREAQFEYARTAERVARVARGILLVREEALRTEDAKTGIMALYAFVHTLDQAEIQTRWQEVTETCQEIGAALDQKETGLARRRMVLVPLWGFVVVFSVLMYRKYLALKRAYVSKPGQVAPAREAVPSLGRRRLLNATLSLMGATAVVALLWPALAFVLPARKRGGGSEHVSAGSEDGWAAWDMRKVSLGGKVVAVIRTSERFRAFSAVCTHLGCIVHWNQAKREFECPCHAATFDAAGQVVSGPPPTPLPEYKVSVVQGEVIVTSAVQS
ncbi:MAG: Rieske 2Fe-2S domain-containing protein [Phycisphaerae bacterium]